MKKIFSRLRSSLKNEDGAIMITVAVGLVVFLSITALVVDGGLIYYQESKLQTALDSAALAAVRKLPNRLEATETALEYVEKNGFSAEDVQVDFPATDVVRVSKTMQTQSLFSGIMSVEKLNNSAHAAAKFVSKSLMLDFPYRLFQGGNSVMQMGGQFAIDGNVHTNGGIKISGGSIPNGVVSPYGDYRSYIHGTVTGASSNNNDYYYQQNAWVGGQNIGTVYYNCWSNHVENVLIGQPAVETPNYDDAIMSIAPTFDESVFRYARTLLRFSMNRYDFYPYFYTWLYLYWNDSAEVNNPNLTELPYHVPFSIGISGDFSGRNHKTVFDGSVYFMQSVSLSRGITVHGNCYCNGDFVQQGGTEIVINGDLYVDGNASFAGKITVGGSVYVKGTFSKGGGSYITVGGDVYSGGDMAFGGGIIITNGVLYSGGAIRYSAGDPVRINGVVIAEDDIFLGGLPIDINAAQNSTLSLYSRNGNIEFSTGSGGSGTSVYGLVYAPNGKVTVGSGNLHFHGSIVGKELSVSSGGVSVGENNRPLPFAKDMKVAVLVE